MIRTALTYVPFLCALLAFLTYVLGQRYRTRAQAVWLMLLLLTSAKFVCFEAFGGDAFNPELPAGVIWPWNILCSGTVILGILALLTRPWRHVRGMRVILPILAWGTAVWGTCEGLRPPVVHEVTVTSPAVGAALDGYRIVQLTDLHISSSARSWRTERIVRAVNALDADLVCLTGDLVDGLPRHRQRDVAPIKDIKARDGVFGCTGNHECYGEWFIWSSLYERFGIRLLANECVLPRPGLAVGGVDDIAFTSFGPGCGRWPDVGRTFAAATNGEFRVLLQHRPVLPPDQPVGRAGVDLQLSGHTHGGIMPLLDRLVAYLNGGYVRGLYDVPREDGRRTALYVSPGTGNWAGFPIRLFTPSEITVLTLRKSSENTVKNKPE